MRPVRITLQNRSFEDFSDDLMKCFAAAVMADEERLRGFYEQMIKQYRSIILDLDTSILLMGLSYGSGWILCEHFVRHTPTPNTLDAYLEKQAEEASNNNMEEMDGFDREPHTPTQPKAFHPNEEVFNRIIERVGISGNTDCLSKGEKEYLNLVAKFYRENGEN